ncbi:hypothetical protein ASE65_05425 [Sphingomonas sp. Leaf16]|nr:hypothetical protein ASE65_05425 [Sphingomonas sp. Leaf16]KQN12938.1 hypothetical protein ASE81_06440 [Sphingomonas sp. Leaf29]KQN19825.1 hypothetical protein ASE83_06365 [Sphingomonas sp. Leaf32]
MTIGLGALLLVSACGGNETAVETNVTEAAAPVETPVAAATPMAAATVTPAAPAEKQSLDAFWTKFRAAALAKDAAGIAALSAPVVVQRGDLDDAPEKRLSPAQVPAVLAALLEQTDGVDAANRTQRQMLQAMPVPKRDGAFPEDQFRFGNMEFERGAQGWRLVRLYYEAAE